MAQPQDYDEKYEKWTYESHPIIPSDWIYKVKDDTKEQYLVLKELLVINTTCYIYIHNKNFLFLIPQQAQTSAYKFKKFDKKIRPKVAYIEKVVKMISKTSVKDPNKMDREKIEKIWQDVLKINTLVKDSDDFFESGGNSFSTLLILKQMNEAGYEINIVNLCESKTFGDLIKKVGV